MAEQVKVEDFEVFRLLRVALLKFAQAAGQALTAADGEIGHTHAWLESEQTAYWQGQLRKRVEAVTRARDALRQKKLYKDSTGRMPDAAVEEKALARCLAAVDEAQHKIEAIRKWLPKLEKESEMYRGSVSRLGGTLAVEVPRAIALLDRLAATLEEYTQVAAPAGNLAESAAGGASEESMSRGGETEPPAQAAGTPPAATAAGQAAATPAGAGQAAPEKEGRNVVDGK